MQKRPGAVVRAEGRIVALFGGRWCASPVLGVVAVSPLRPVAMESRGPDSAALVSRVPLARVLGPNGCDPLFERSVGLTSPMVEAMNEG